MEFQLGSLYINVEKYDDIEGIAQFRLILPIGTHMMRCIVNISEKAMSASIDHVFFYKRGDKDAEESALTG